MCKNLTRPLFWEEILLYETILHYVMLMMESANFEYQQHELVAAIDIEEKPQLNLAYAVTLPGRSLAIICIYNNLDPEQSGQIYEIEPSHYLMKNIPTCVLSL